MIQAQKKEGEKDSVLQSFLTQLKSGSGEIPTLKLVLKADGSSSLEALQQAVQGVPIPENVDLKVIHADVGHFSDSDLALAQASKALLLGFSIGLHSSVKKAAQGMGVDVKNFDIIYELTEYLEKLLLGMVEIEEEEVSVGKLEVLGVFFRKGKEMVIGGKVVE
ncbi:MAG: hypothetical protein GXP45_02935 [bacterium]|nr:hypothetical protein [bacterium]